MGQLFLSVGTLIMSPPPFPPSSHHVQISQKRGLGTEKSNAELSSELWLGALGRREGDGKERKRLGLGLLSLMTEATNTAEQSGRWA